MLLRATPKAASDKGNPRHWNVRRMLLVGAGALCGLFLCFALVSSRASAQTPHSITIAIPGYTQGADTATGFNFYRGTTSGGPYTKLNSAPVPLNTTTPPAVQFVDTTGVGGTTYFYVVTALDATGNESANSNEVGATFLANPAAPSGITATVK